MLADLASRENIVAPSMIIVGEVAAFSEKLSWFEAARHAPVAR
jgi:siroheme synthase